MTRWLAPGGSVTLVCYSGHPGGQIELRALQSYLAGIPQQQLEVIELSLINQINSPAHILVITS
ncbi:MAG TPA: class I SAM-dependent methyltransferase [Syntrophomonadaceae bacterium]|nr:class I SAM-dependent methyltransferase [Syntrophomonadaceae bacterium]